MKKNNLAQPLAAFWQAISEVPGWPDAPLPVRLRRMWPLVVPLLVCSALAIWVWGMREPWRADVRARHAAALSLEEELTQLQQACSEQQAEELGERAASAQARLLESPSVVESRLEGFVGRARATGWKVSAQVYGSTDTAEGGEAMRPLVHVPARLRLEPRPGNPDPFNSLMGLLRVLLADDARFEITALSLQSDQPGTLVAELNVRAACRPAP